MRHDPRTCRSDDCPACQDAAEARAEPQEWDDHGGQDAYERQLDRQGGSL